MGRGVTSPVAVVLVLCALLTGVKGEAMDTDLIGVVVAGVCVTVLIIIIVAFVSCCCCRRLEGKRRSALVRKESGSISTNGLTPRWAPNMVFSGVPIYSLPPDPLMYAVPPSQYYLGNYEPKFVDAETLEYMHQHHHHQGPHRRRASDRVEEDGEDREEHTLRRTEHVEQQEQEVSVQGETPRVVQVETAPQPNGHAPHEFSASSENYKVIRKQHKHEKMPEWLRKSYGESERTMDIEDEGSRASSVRSTSRLVMPPTPEQAVRAHVSPVHATLDSEDILKVPESFTIVDYVDPETRSRSSYILGEEQHITTSLDPITGLNIISIAGNNVSGSNVVDTNNIATGNIIDTNVTSNVTNTTDTNVTSDGSITITTTTTTYRTQEDVLGVIQTSDSTHDPPASTSTPRFGQLPRIEVQAETDSASSRLESYRMRKPGQGSLTNLPDAAAVSDVP